MTVDQFRTDASRSSHADRPSSLIDRIAAGEPYAVSFGGQGVNWLPTLAELVIDAELERSLGRVIDAATRLLDPVAGQLLIARPDGFTPMTWVHALDAGEATPTESTLTSAALSVPGIVLTQIAAIAALRKQGLDTVAYPPSSVVGHSQGALSVDALSAEQDQTPAGEGALLALAHLIGAAGSIVAARRGLAVTADGSPMLSISNVTPARIGSILAEYSASRKGDDHTLPVVAIRNGRRSVVVAGAPRHLAALRDECERLAAAEADERKRKVAGGSPFAPDFDMLDISIAFHHPGMADAVDLVASWAADCGLDPQWARRHAAAVFIDRVDWVSTIDDVIADGAKWILDFGPSDVVTRLSVPLVRGAGVGLVATALRVGQRNLFSPGGVPEVPRPWTQYAPQLVTLPDGRTVVDTSFTRLTGRSPVLLAGMTPTTVDPAIVAAAANAGHWAELAGGGQVTEEIFAQNVAKLTELLEPGRQAQFNSLFLDPYLWKLQLGGNRIVQKARAQGAPLDGVIVTAGIPELDDAVALVDELAEAGLRYVAFKPGTVSQIRDVIRIAAEVPHHPIIVHIEGGRAGGHHSWEDLDDLLLATYGELRARPNVVVCVGGGIGTPDRASDYLLGTWAHRHQYPTMPLDGVLIGTAAMATLEATTSPDVKQLLVETAGCDEWIGAGHAHAGIASGRSQLGADIHEIDNTASRCGRLLDEVAGDADLVADRRAEIIGAMAKTAKPYFGDVAQMTYREWLERYAALAVGGSGERSDGGWGSGERSEGGWGSGERSDGGLGSGEQLPWADITWQRRFIEMCQRTEARMNDADTGEIPTMFAAAEATDDPYAAIDALISVYPAVEVDLLHPADVAFFIELCKTPGKPVNFVPVIDKDVRRWWRSDSLWQAHDPRYGADAVCIIPGPVAVAGITRVDEPVGDLLNRFEAQVAADLAAAGEQPIEIDSRRRGELAGAGAISALLAADDVRWAGRMVRSPIALLGDRDQWNIVDPQRAEHAGTGAVLAGVDETDSATTAFELVVPIARSSVRIPLQVPASVLDGGSPIVGLDDASVAMLDILRVAAGGELAPTIADDNRVSAQTVVAWDPDSVADHAAVTGYTLPTNLRATTTAQELGFAVPDTLVGACWPSVFSVIGAARTDDGVPVVEGLLDLVHLDHVVHLVGEIPAVATDLRVDAAAISVVDANVGRVVEVEVRVTDVEFDAVVASFVERFAIRGRLGEAELVDPSRAGGASDDERSAQRKLLRATTITAPHQMNGFAFVSGDHNPIHTDANAAKLAGLGVPIVHGMWLSAAAQQVLTATDARNPIPAPRPIRGWTARFLGMVRTGDQIAIRVDRVGLDAGREVVEVTAKVDDNLVMAATALLEAPRTVYAFPGQGIQSAGMGLDARSRSKAAREIWDRADAHTRAALGFSILAVVRDNPTTLVADGVTYQHPDGVLYLTQFTQVAMATLGVAQVAELKESGGFVENAITCGHSVGEYNALAACAGVLPLEAVLEVVFQRGSAMHHLVPRDDLGRSNYRMAAIRPSQFGLADDHVADYVTQVGADAGEFLEVVNLNLRGSQYAIAGTVRGLEHLEADIDRRRAEFGGKRAFILVPGIDVPFHSTVLRDGVPAFRERLEELLPADLDPNILIGRYIPNLVPRLFNLSREFVTEIAELVPSEPLAAVLADFEYWAARPSELTRVVLIELLAWQFASPVRWIETQDLLFSEPERGGLAIQRFVEIGVKSAPTLSGLATNTLKLDGFANAVTEVLNVERDSAAVLAQDEGVEPEADSVSEAAEEPKTEAAPAAAVPAAVPAAAAGPRPDDLRFGPSDAVTAVIALWTKMRTDQIGAVDTIEALCDGVSSRRNQLLLDVGAELNLGAIDGAAEADMAALASTVETLARGYRPLGAVLTDAVGDQMRKVLGPVGKRPSYITDRVTNVWQLESGWGLQTLVALALGTREGASVRGGDLGNLLDGPVSNVEALDALIDRAVSSVGAAQGVSVSLPSAGGTGGGATVDAAALSEFTENITGRSGVLASAAYTVLSKLGLVDEESADLGEVDDEAAVLAERVSSELGSDWARTVAPSFDEGRAVLIDDRWASAREDLARLWLLDELDVDTDFEALTAKFIGAGRTVAQHATWWQGKALAQGNAVHARAFGAIAQEAEEPNAGVWSDDIAVVTGASAGSIAAAVVGALLAGGATVIATTSRLDSERLDFYKELYRNNARKGAALWVAPANLASYTDVDDLVEWIGAEQTENLGSTTGVVKPAMKPTLLFPFAAPRVAGDLTDAGGRAELEMKVLLWSVERLIAGLADVHADHNIDARVHVVLPGSPNRGMFGGDGAYGESKAALDALVTRWSAEESWQSKTTLAHALIGWVRGTGLMGHNDGMVAAVEAAGVKTWATEEMAAELLELCTPAQREAARTAPILADFTAGLDPAAIDLKALAAAAAEAEDVAETDHAQTDDAEQVSINALSAPARAPRQAPISWSEINVSPEDLVVIVGAGELGPYGSARTRFEMEVDEKLSAAGVLELAWNTGLVTWESTPKPGWYDVESGDPVAEADIADRYHDEVVARCGIRRYADDGEMVDNSSPLLTSVFLDEDLSFAVASEAEARAFASADPERTRVVPNADTGDWQVTRLAGTEIRVPRRFALSRTVGGQIPTGFDPTRWGVSADMAESVDRVALWNLVATVDAFLSSGFSPEELMRWVHPGLVANTQGTGMGGMQSMRSLYLDTLLGEAKANDILQEALPNVVAAHVVQSYIGSYGAMIHPVAACATAAVSVEEGVDKIKLGKALFAVAGGFDDLGIEGIVGFGDMSATADSAKMSARGIDDRRFSRANDRRRGGFVESNGGGTVLLARGDVAAQMGLPVLGVVAHAQSFGDGVHTSIPAPGLGALGAARGGPTSPLATALNSLGVSADDVAVISKHDTSTRANDPNEAKLHEELASAIGRNDGAPLFVVSQKSLTGHAKGGAAAFQLIGLCQMLGEGVIPPNRSLDCVDDAMEKFNHLVWPRETLRMAGRFPLKAGLLTSLGFGHVSGLIAVVHPEAFVASLDEAARDAYRARRTERLRDGSQRMLEAMCGGRPAYQRPPNRRFDESASEAGQETELLLSADGRLDADGTYEVRPAR
ncbi:fatty-acid synthase I [Gordonia effusa NBRC 100432]|uniref:Fatty-acid synthase I n=1 Tax=Gordonia effusa NBRC 100432 TaxID=1077974 RepID=H0R6C2_9ACTN|nr:type I polyketide synthase [Gordonia effusa]GAB20623.1 fatty-acid synthase I [Gordonia effusa NBRC 100432]